jgi:Sigma-70, region 4
MDSKKHRYLREALRRYKQLEALFIQNGQSVVRGPDGIEICFFDLKDSLEKLSPRKKEAIFYNVIMDMKQKDVADKMGITTVSVGQYVESGFMQIAEDYFNETREDSDIPKRRRRKYNS